MLHHPRRLCLAWRNGPFESQTRPPNRRRPPASASVTSTGRGGEPERVANRPRRAQALHHSLLENLDLHGHEIDPSDPA